MGDFMINLAIVGLLYDILGVFILTLVAIIDPRHQTTYPTMSFFGKPPNKIYWWHARRPFYKNTKTLKWKINLKRVVIVEGIIPPKTQWNVMGLWCVILGFFLQILYYLV